MGGAMLFFFWFFFDQVRNFLLGGLSGHSDRSETAGATRGTTNHTCGVYPGIGQKEKHQGAGYQCQRRPPSTK
jgi:hypothetical protein